MRAPLSPKIEARLEKAYYLDGIRLEPQAIVDRIVDATASVMFHDDHGSDHEMGLTWALSHLDELIALRQRAAEQLATAERAAPVVARWRPISEVRYAMGLILVRADIRLAIARYDKGELKRQSGGGLLSWKPTEFTELPA